MLVIIIELDVNDNDTAHLANSRNGGGRVRRVRRTLKVGFKP
jgi:hypothetical protein